MPTSVADDESTAAVEWVERIQVLATRAVHWRLLQRIDHLGRLAGVFPYRLKLRHFQPVKAPALGFDWFVLWVVVPSWD